MIVRLMNEGQYRIDDDLRQRLNQLDDQAMEAVDANDEQQLAGYLQEMWDLVQMQGERVPDNDLTPSDLLIPPADLSIEETKQLFSDDGLIPDLPV